VALWLQNANDFLPIAQYIDEFSISCSLDMLNSILTKKLNKTISHDKVYEQLNAQVFPNPAIDQVITVALNNQKFFDGKIDILSMSGKKIMSKPIYSGTTTFNSTKLRKGLYLIKGTSGNQEVQHKIVIQ